MTTRLQKIEMAVAHAKRARDLLRETECKLAADTFAKALKSAEGALRNARLRAEHNDAVRAALAATRQEPAYLIAA